MKDSSKESVDIRLNQVQRSEKNAKEIPFSSIESNAAPKFQYCVSTYAQDFFSFFFFLLLVERSALFQDLRKTKISTPPGRAVEISWRHSHLLDSTHVVYCTACTLCKSKSDFSHRQNNLKWVYIGQRNTHAATFAHLHILQGIFPGSFAVGSS